MLMIERMCSNRGTSLHLAHMRAPNTAESEAALGDIEPRVNLQFSSNCSRNKSINQGVREQM